MCGIAGFSISDADRQVIDSRKLAEALVLEIKVRGSHATGVVWSQFTTGESQPTIWYAKDNVPADRFIKTLKHVPRRSRTVLLHTRYATQGSSADNHNNHPIILPGVSLVHNGVIHNDDELIKELKADRVGLVDSEAMAWLVESSSDYGQTLGKAKGSAAIAWIKTNAPRTLHLARLETSPLCIAETVGGSLVFASTKPLLEAALKTMKLETAWIREINEMTYLRIRAGKVEDMIDVKRHHAKPILTTQDYMAMGSRDMRYAMPVIR